MDPIKPPHAENVDDFKQRTLSTIFLPIRNGGCGFQSAVRNLDAAYTGSWALVAHSMVKLHPGFAIAAQEKHTWPAFDAYLIALSHVTPHIKDPEILQKLSPSLIFSEATPKVQNIISHATSADIADTLFRSLTTGPPTSGPSAGLYLPDKDKSVRIQAIANREKTSSAWISANPLMRNCRMSDGSFKTAWKIRTLQPLFPHNLFCKCGAEIDRLGYHFYVCPDKSISSKVRYKMHTALKDSVIETGDSYFSSRNVRASPREPQMKNYFNPLPPPPSTRTPTQSQQSEAEETNPFRNPMGPNRRADIAFLPARDDEYILLVDVTTISPLVKNLQKNAYVAGSLADVAVKGKLEKYLKHFDTISSFEAGLWFFAIETNGVFSREAKRFCQLMAQVAEAPSILQTIYQRLSVAIQNCIAVQIYAALQSYTTTERNSHRNPAAAQ
jgi:hypothetical protein